MRVNNITKKYANKVVLDNFSYNFEDGKITAIMGESGVGKTTLLNIIAGVENENFDIENKTKSIVFQNDRLLPNLTVADNLRLINEEININKVLADFDLENSEQLYPKELSAGMSRRVAIIRAIYYSAELLLMDEPFRNLDYYLKYKIMDIIKDKQKENKNTILIVTHDIAEAVYMADNIVVMGCGGSIVYETKNITKNTEKELLDVFLNKNK